MRIIFPGHSYDEALETAAFCGISAMPTFIFYQNKEKIDSVTGASQKKLEDTLKKHNK
ncbi:thioredoxin 1 [Paramuricea clavata]|uniref:Thioredoxin 1 n=1 Tax=Paramuricea clavata TaxID=317549 RepID=A0A6S7G7C0_PARCT|nr:thioredoxin 1 [Paramuricea clavata]